PASVSGSSSTVASGPSTSGSSSSWDFPEGSVRATAFPPSPMSALKVSSIRSGASSSSASASGSEESRVSWARAAGALPSPRRPAAAREATSTAPRCSGFFVVVSFIGSGPFRPSGRIPRRARSAREGRRAARAVRAEQLGAGRGGGDGGRRAGRNRGRSPAERDEQPGQRGRDQADQAPQRGLAVREQRGGQQRRPQVPGEHRGVVAQRVRGVRPSGDRRFRRRGAPGEQQVERDLRGGQHREDLAELAPGAGEPGE